jgi:hypothetical protein
MRKKHGLRPVKTSGDLEGRLFDIPSWNKMTMEQRLAFIDEFTQDKARDPKLVEFVAGIFNHNNIKHTDHASKWRVLLLWVQQNIRYNMEPGERLQSPQYTLNTAGNGQGMADCDDMAILLAALGYCANLPYRLVICGRDARGNRAQYIYSKKVETLPVLVYPELATRRPRPRPMRVGGNVPPGVTWTHIYVLVGDAPGGGGCAWTYAEPTLPAPLGWDVCYGGALPGGMQGGVTGGRSDLSGDFGAIIDGRAITPLLQMPSTVMGNNPPAVVADTAPASAPATLPVAAPETSRSWLSNVIKDIKSRVSIGQVVAAVAPPVIAALLLQRIKRGRG